MFPTRITQKTVTLIDNICVNNPVQNYNSWNITTSVSDHFLQFIIIENGKGDNPASKMSKTTQRDYKRFDNDSSKIDLQSIGWSFAIHNNYVKLELWSFSADV